MTLKNLEPGRAALSLTDLNTLSNDASQFCVLFSLWVFQSRAGTQETYSLCGTPSQFHSAGGTVEKYLRTGPCTLSSTAVST